MFYRYSRILSVVLKAVGVAALLGLPLQVHSQTISANGSGTQDGFFYVFWKDSGEASIRLEAGGRYTALWNNTANNWFGGKGWQPGGDRVIQYTGTFTATGSANAYLSLYGWTKSPVVEYYIVESWGSYNPGNCSGGRILGRYQADGANYELHDCRRRGAGLEINQAPLYFSVRVPKNPLGAISGTIDTGRHFDEWKKLGVNLGTHDYMIMATEGYQSGGSSDITVSLGEGPGSSSSSASSSSSSSSSSSGARGNSSSSSSSGAATSGAVGGGADVWLIGGGLFVALGFKRKRTR